MSNLIQFPGGNFNRKVDSEYTPRTNIKDLEIAIKDEQVDTAIYYTLKKMVVTRAEEVDALNEAARFQEAKNTDELQRVLKKFKIKSSTSNVFDCNQYTERPADEQLEIMSAYLESDPALRDWVLFEFFLNILPQSARKKQAG